jgi:hypothetical protein
VGRGRGRKVVGEEEEEEGSFWPFLLSCNLPCVVVLLQPKNICGGCLLLNAFRVLERVVQPFPSQKSNIHPSTNSYITYINSPFLDEFIITWYLIKYPSIHQWLYNLYNSPFLEEFIITWYLIKYPSTNGHITYINSPFLDEFIITQYLIKYPSTNGYITYINSPFFLDEFIITQYLIKGFNQSFTSLTCLVNPLLLPSHTTYYLLPR